MAAAQWLTRHSMVPYPLVKFNHFWSGLDLYLFTLTTVTKLLVITSCMLPNYSAIIP